MEAMVDLSIIIVNWNVKDILKTCLKSIYEEDTTISLEVFVVDNASSDSSAEMVLVDFPQVKLIMNKKNFGFAKANNQAIQKSNGRYVLLLNPDVIVFPDTFSKMVSFMDTHFDVGVSGCKILKPDGNFQVSARDHFPSLLSEFTYSSFFRGGHPLGRIVSRHFFSYWEHDYTREVSCVIGTCLMVRREAIDQVGLLDEEFYIYVEDTDWCYRMKQAGWKINFISDAKIIHYGGQSTKQSSSIGTQHFENTYKYFKKHHGVLYAKCYKALIPINIFLRMMIRLLQYAITNKNSRAAVEQRIGGSLRLFKWSMAFLRKNG